jgi:hypothetical protein
LSLDADHDTEILVCVDAVTLRFAGAVGACLSRQRFGEHGRVTPALAPPGSAATATVTSAATARRRVAWVAAPHM